MLVRHFAMDSFRWGAAGSSPLHCREEHSLRLSRAIPSVWGESLLGVKSVGIFTTDFSATNFFFPFFKKVSALLPFLSVLCNLQTLP